MTTPKKDQESMSDQSSASTPNMNQAKDKMSSGKLNDALLMNDDDTEREDENDQLDSMSDNARDADAGKDDDQEDADLSDDDGNEKAGSGM